MITAIDEIVSIKRIARALNLSTATVAKMSRRGDFPKPINLGVRKLQYLRSQLDAWWHERLGGQNGQPFPLSPDESGDEVDDPTPTTKSRR